MTGNKKDNTISLVFCALIAEMDLATINLINMFFISRGLGEDGTAAYELIMPFLFLFSAVLALGYNGIQAVCSKDYGYGSKDTFERHKNTGYTWLFGSIVLLAVFFSVFRDQVLDLLGANEAGEVIAGLSRECYLLNIPSFVLLSIFCAASCLLFLEERKVLIICNIILYVVLIAGNILVLELAPSMTGFIGMNLISEGIADVFLVIYWIMKHRTSVSAYTRFRIAPRDIRTIFLTGLPDFLEYGFSAVMSLVLNLYVLYRFSSAILAGMGIFEAAENFPELICVGFCFLSTSALGVRAGRIINSTDPGKRKEAETGLLEAAGKLTRYGTAGALIVSALLIILSKPLVAVFFKDYSGTEASDSAVLMIIGYAIGFTFYILNSELFCYYKIVKAYTFAHVACLADALVFPLLSRIILGEFFGITGFCLGGALGGAMTMLLNLLIIRKNCGHFPLRLKDFMLDKYLRKNNLS